MKKILLTLFIFFFSTSSFSKTMYGVGILGGIGILSESGSSDNVSKKGLLLEGKALTSFIQEKYVSDISLGWSKRSLSGDNNGQSILVETESLFFGADLKYKMGKFLLGPGLKFYFGEDNSYKSFKDEKTVASNVGLVLQYLLRDSDRNQIRLEGSVYQDIGDSKLITTGIGVVWLFGQEKEEVKSVEKPPEISKKIVEKEDEPDFKVVLKSARILFDSASHKLDSDLSNRLEKLALFLSKENKNWKKVRVSGHTDNVGSFEYNEQLAGKRAETIKNVLIKNGVDSKKIESKSYSYSKPIDSNDTEEGRSRNRRTEIEFFGVENKDVLNKAIIDILTK